MSQSLTVSSENTLLSQSITLTEKEILHQVKLSCQIPTIVEGILTRKVIENAATKTGLRIETEELQQAADQLRLMNRLYNADETWKWFKKCALSLDDFEEKVYINLLTGKLAQHLFSDQVEPYFYEHQLDYANAVIYEVILDDEELAMEHFYELQEEETTFFEIAQQYIEDPELRRKGGYLGLVKRQQMKAEISAKVFAATPPEILKPIVTSKGVHLIQVEEIIEPHLEDRLRYQILSDLFTEWLKKQVEELSSAINLDAITSS